MMSDSEAQTALSSDDSSPRHKHLRKLAAEAEALKKAKAAQEPIKVEYEIVHDTRGRPKYRKVTVTPNGNKHRELVSEAEAKAFFKKPGK